MRLFVQCEKAGIRSGSHRGEDRNISTYWRRISTEISTIWATIGTKRPGGNGYNFERFLRTNLGAILRHLEFTVQKIRVLVANRPRLMRELVLATMAEQPDIEIVGEAQNEGEITDLVDRTRPDFLIIALEDPERHPSLCGFLLGRYPRMRILAVSSGHDDSTCYWAFVDIRSRTIPTSEEGILGAMRDVAGHISVSN